MFIGLVWLTSNHMFGSGDFWDKSPILIFENFEIALVLLIQCNLKIFKNALGQLISNCPPKHVITSTKCCLCNFSWKLLLHISFISYSWRKCFRLLMTLQVLIHYCTTSHFDWKCCFKSTSSITNVYLN